VQNVVLSIALVVTAALAPGACVAGSEPGLCRPVPAPRQQAQGYAHGSGRTAGAGLDDTTVIVYDDGTPQTWWCSDKDSFGAAVRFTPAAYPCYVVGARAEVGCDTTAGGRQVYLRVFDDDGIGGLPGTVLYEQLRRDVPQGHDTVFRDYDLTSPVTIDSGDFYLCFWQKSSFNMYFSSDTHFDSMPREWWFLPGQGWVTPSGMDAADHLIRALVLYPTGVEESLKPQAASRTRGPAIVRSVLFLPNGASSSPGTSYLLDMSGRKVMDLHPRANDVRALAPGVYFVLEAVSGRPSAVGVRKVVISR